MNEFDQKASQWDAKPVRVERALAMADGIRAALPLSSSLTALEYGCGTGLVSFELQSQLGHITLADSSSGMLAVVREKIAASQREALFKRTIHRRYANERCGGE